MNPPVIREPVCRHCGDIHPDEAVRCTKTGRALGEDDRLLGQLIDRRYRIVRLLGKSPFGAVYKAEHATVGRSVALRVLPAHLVQDPFALELFFQETRLVGSLSHPHLHPLVDAGLSPEGVAYVAYAYLRGRSLGSALLVDAPLPLEHAARIIVDVLAGLGALHESGFVHRFLSPESVLLGGDTRDLPRAVLTNLAAVAHRDAGRFPEARVLVPPEFVPPETDKAFPADPRQDIYAAGMMLAACLSPGGRPRMGSELLALGVPAVIEAVVARAVTRHPPARFESAAAMTDALRSYARDDTWDMRSATATHISDLRALRRREQPPSAAANVEVDGAFAVPLLDSLRSAIGARHHELAAMTERIRAEYPKGRIPLRTLATTLERTDALLGTGDRLFCSVVGEALADIVVAESERTEGSLTPELFLDGLGVTWALGLGNRHARVKSLGRGYARLECRAHPEPRLAICACYTGMLGQALARLRARNVEVNKTACQAAGDNACIYSLTWG